MAKFVSMLTIAVVLAAAVAPAVYTYASLA